MATKTLIFAGGTVHDFHSVGTAAKSALEAAGDFDITYVEEDLNVLVAPKLDAYELLVFHYTVGQITDAQKNGLLNWVNGRKGFAGIHSAADSFRSCPEYRAMIGGHFVTHPRYREYQVSLAEKAHPIIEGLDREFMVTDEQYILDYDPRVNVLASGLWQGQAMPVVWTKNWGEGRVFYLALGHDGPACEHAMFNQLLARGARWAAG